jgi:hypothetical protein
VITDSTETTDSTESNETNESIQNSKTTKTKTTKPKIIKPNILKPIQPKFEGTCTHCSKLFKHIKLYEKHINEQLCYKDCEITYCKICLLTCKNHQEYKNHLFSIEHINNIGFNSIEKFIKPTSSVINILDPYLNKNDINTLSSNNLGDNFTFVYEKGDTQTITLQKPKKNNESNTTNLSNTINTIINTIINTDTNMTTQNNIQIFIPEPIPEPTVRQTKIINILEKQIEKNTINESGSVFYKLLDKLQLEDYKGLQKIIKTLNINQDYKLNFLNTIDIFISVLVKEKTNGNTFYKEKDISQIVINLTS